MNQAEVAKLMSQLRFKIQPSYRRLSQPKGPEGRLNKLRQTVTALIKYERLELYHPRADETRGYAERVRILQNSFPFSHYLTHFISSVFS